MSAALRFLSLVALLPLASTGCGINLDAEIDPNVNTCTASSDCGSEGTCVSIQTGDALCVATAADLGPVILEVRPNGGIASYVFVDVPAVVGENAKGMVQNHDITLPESVSVTGDVAAPDGLSEACRGADGNLPVDITLIRKVEFSVFASRYEIPSPLALDATGAASFTASVPPGAYDMYVQPYQLAACDEALPAPQLVSGIELVEGEPFEYSIGNMEVTEPLSGELIVPTGVSLQGWTLEVLDPTYGYVISNSFLLTDPEPEKDFITIDGFYYHSTPNALVRLRDTSGNLTVHWSLDALDLNSDGVIELDLRDLVADSHTYSASVVNSAGEPVPGAGVIIQSSALTGSASQNANYRVETIADAEGFFSVALVQGTYSVSISGESEGDAAYFGEWVVTADPDEFGKGKGFELVEQPVLRGSVSDPLGFALPGATVSVGPSLGPTTSYFTRAVVDPEPLRRQFSTTAFADGSFELSVDPGEVDMTVQTSAASGYPWSVLPSLKVDEAEVKPALEVGEVQLRYPAVLQGHVSASGAALPYAQIRAWVRGGANGDGPLIQVGAADTDADGGYVLSLPPGITIDTSAPADSQNGQ